MAGTGKSGFCMHSLAKARQIRNSQSLTSFHFLSSFSYFTTLLLAAKSQKADSMGVWRSVVIITCSSLLGIWYYAVIDIYINCLRLTFNDETGAFTNKECEQQKKEEKSHKYRCKFLHASPPNGYYNHTHHIIIIIVINGNEKYI